MTKIRQVELDARQLPGEREALFERDGHGVESLLPTKARRVREPNLCHDECQRRIGKYFAIGVHIEVI